MIPVLLASPWAGDTERHRAYAIECVRDALARGEAPLAPHLLYPQALDDGDPHERATGLAAGLAWLSGAARLVAYVDLGVSSGMAHEIEEATLAGVPVERRTIGLAAVRVVGARR
jgi:hypothetical protein